MIWIKQPLRGRGFVDASSHTLGAHREACEAFIKSQAHEGWNHGRQMFLKISAAKLDISAAIRERCASIVREGGAIAEIW